MTNFTRFNRRLFNYISSLSIFGSSSFEVFQDFGSRVKLKVQNFQKQNFKSPFPLNIQTCLHCVDTLFRSHAQDVQADSEVQGNAYHIAQLVVPGVNF